MDLRPGKGAKTRISTKLRVIRLASFLQQTNFDAKTDYKM